MIKGYVFIFMFLLLAVTPEAASLSSYFSRLFGKDLRSELELSMTCSYDGKDFSSLSREIQLSDYIIHLCGTIQQPGHCQDASATVCKASGMQQTVLAAWGPDAGEDAKWMTDAKGLPYMVFQNSLDPCPSDGSTIRTEIRFMCGDGNPYVQENGCTYTVMYPTKLVCSKSSKLSGGSIFLIILAVVIPVYIIAGCVWNWKKNGLRGWEACPNRGFWKALWVNAKAGCAVTRAKICRGSSQADTYAPA